MVLVDTSVWSLALRRSAKPASGTADELRKLIADRHVQMIGPIRQELLSGLRNAAPFERLNKHLSAFPDREITTDDYVTAARYFNLCRSRGIQGSNTDFLICAVAVRNRWSIFTTDRDFSLFAGHLPIVLHNA